jgi:restriction system protein
MGVVNQGEPLKLKMAKNSLFAILLRSPWWASLLLAGGLALLARLVLPERFAIAGALGTLPFVVIAAMAAWKQLRAPSAAQVENCLRQLSAMSARDFGDALETAFRHQGHEVQRLKAGAAELELSRGGQRTLVGLRRWKAASTGIEPLRELHAAMLRHEADGCIYVAGGEISEKAIAFAKEKNIRLLGRLELAQLVAGAPRSA